MLTNQRLIADLRRPDAYPHAVKAPVEVHQTHISIIFLAGDFAYKIKQAIKTDFLDYSTLRLRKHFCDEEIRLDRRFVQDLYLGVVPVTRSDDGIEIQGSGETIEYAVKMRRFPDDALLSQRIGSGKLTTSEVDQLAATVAGFHQKASVGKNGVAAEWPEFLRENAGQIIRTLASTANHKASTKLDVLGDWLDDFFGRSFTSIDDRVAAGFVRECHGDLHLANVVHWENQLVPFDGIEFNEHLRWIDTLSDAAFLAMDFAAHNRLDLSRRFTNAYLERTGDYDSLHLLRLFLVYRSLVRALAASMRDDQVDTNKHVALAHQFTLGDVPQLWITHGLSGSGKTTLSQNVIQRRDAIRLRSDIERKRMFGLLPHMRPAAELTSKLYSDDSNKRTYLRLHELARGVLAAGYSVIVDATFLKQADRQRFRDLAEKEGVCFAILDCQSDVQTLRKRVADRANQGNDASDADIQVLEHQIANNEPLSDEERDLVVDIPDVMQFAKHL